jgi:hypothetical protein
MANVGIFYDHLEYFMTIWYNLWPFGIVCGHLLYFPALVCLDQEKSGNPARTPFSPAKNIFLAVSAIYRRCRRFTDMKVFKMILRMKNKCFASI